MLQLQYSLYTMDLSQRCTTLGDNIYNGKCSSVGVAERTRCTRTTHVSGRRDARKLSRSSNRPSDGDEMRLLSKLINRGEHASRADGFVLSLFDNDARETTPSDDGSAQRKPDALKTMHNAPTPKRTRARLTQL